MRPGTAGRHEQEEAMPDATTGTDATTKVRWMRTTMVRNGKGAMALQAGAALAALAGARAGIAVSVFYDVAGGGSKIWWMADLPDMGTAERVLRGLMSDREYLAMVDNPSVQELFIDGTTQDSLLLMMSESHAGPR
jgi:hypothetical protein